MNKYQEMFLSEAYEHLDSLDVGLIDFEKKPHDAEIAAELMRHAHTFKGMAASMDYGEISNLAHSFEGMVENIKNSLAQGSGVKLLFGALDELRDLVKGVENGSANIQKANSLVDELGELEHDDLKKDADTVQKPETFKHFQEVKVKTFKLDQMVDLAAEILISKLRLEKDLKDIVGDANQKFSEGLDTHACLIEDLQYQVLQLRLTPLLNVFNRFPRMVRDLAKHEEKSVEFILRGSDIELDRTILDGLGEPLVHLLRNAVDHGIADKGKGVITLQAKRDRGQVQISVHNTGNSVDWEAVEKKAKETGKWQEGMSKEDMLFSGLSTAKKITEISGRGVGLSVVLEKIDELGGSVIVESKEGEGTKFILNLPVSLAIIKALLVKVSGQTFAVPFSGVERLITLVDSEVSKQANQDVIVVNSEQVPVILMHNVLNVGIDESVNLASQTVLLVKLKNSRVGLIIDSVEAQQDIIVKPLTKVLRSSGYFSAVTILGEGNPVPILDLESVVSRL